MEEKFEDRKVKVTNVYRRNQKAKAQTVVNKGGAGSAKSYSLCQYMLFERLLKIPGYHGLILRKTRQSLKLSTYQDFIEIMESAGLYREELHNKTDMIIRWPGTKGYILFGGLDKREKVKSTQWHDIWLEEGNEFEREDYTFCKTRLYRGVLPKGFMRPQLRISYNPVMCWIQKHVEGKPNVDLIRSTYKDNPFINEEYKRTLKSLKDEDLTYYKIYALGEDAEPEHLIYKPYITIPEIPKDEQFRDIFYGLDFGFNHPTVLVKICDGGDNKLYLNQLIYRTQLTNPEKISLMKECIPEEHRGREIFADCEDPNAIQEIRDAGFNVIATVKGPGSVKAGIDFCKRKTFYTVEDNLELNEERFGYKWKVDRLGNVTDEPVKFRDHGMDAKRYGVYGHFVKLGVPGTLKKALADINESPDSRSSRYDGGIFEEE